MALKKNFTKLLDITKDEASALLDRAGQLKKKRREGQEYKPLKDRCLAMIFEKASTRTRVSFEVASRELGGYAVVLNAADTQIGRGEPVKDTARVLSRYADAVMIRTYGQDVVEELARWSDIPVINGLTDLYHPCQILSDLFTIREVYGGLEGIHIAYIGDGNNVANSWLEAAILMDLEFSMATPLNYLPDESLLARAKAKKGFIHTDDPYKAVEGADVIYTDVWVSMGQEKEKTERKKAFASYCIDEDLMKKAHKAAIVLHCLPAYRNEEITDEIFERFQRVIFDQAENRLHVQKSLLHWLMAG